MRSYLIRRLIRPATGFDNMRQLRVLALIGLLMLIVASISMIPAYAAKAVPASQMQDSLPADSSLIQGPGGTVEATFWNVPYSVQCDVILTYAFAAFGLGAGFLFVGKIKNMLENGNRRRVYEYVHANPGCTIADVAAVLGMNIGTVNYHLNMLEKEHKICLDRQEKAGKFVRLYSNTVARNENYKKVCRHIHNTVSKAMLVALMENPGITNKHLTEIFGLKKSTVSWHIDRFSTDGIVSAIQEGRLKRYFVNDEVRNELYQLTCAGNARTKSDFGVPDIIAVS